MILTSLLEISETEYWLASDNLNSSWIMNLEQQFIFPDKILLNLLYRPIFLQCTSLSHLLEEILVAGDVTGDDPEPEPVVPLQDGEHRADLVLD